jgi:hypothetical protein
MGSINCLLANCCSNASRILFLGLQKQQNNPDGGGPEANKNANQQQTRESSEVHSKKLINKQKPIISQDTYASL